MKFMHLSDLHIGLKLINQDLSEDQNYILDRVVEIAKEEAVDAVVIAGDIYDKAIPSAEAVEIFDRFVDHLARELPQTEIMMISGNHDSAVRINTFRNVLARQHVRMIGLPPRMPGETIEKVVLDDSFGKVNFYLLPFVKPSMVRLIVGTDENGNNLSYDQSLHKLLNEEPLDERERNILVSHQFYLPEGKNPEEVERMESEVCTVGNIDAVQGDILKRFDYVALGHIHKAMKVGSECCRYCGTLLACSVSEADQEKGICIVELGPKGDVQVRTRTLTPLRKVRVFKGTLEEVLKLSCEDYVTVILTDTVDLDVWEMQDRLHFAFPHLLEIRRETDYESNYSAFTRPEKEMDAFELCCSFLNDPEEGDKELLRDVINQVRGVNA